MTDLHGWITQQVDETEAVARAAADGDSGEWFMGRKWNVYRAEDETPSEDGETNELVAYGNVKDQSEHIAHHDPAAVLRRCEADRRILERHRLATEWTWAHPRDAPCYGCGTQGDCDDPLTDNLNQCPELWDLAHAHGITDEIRAGLDKPEMPPRPERRPVGPTPDTSRVPASLRGTHWKGRP
ncbi:DUF6221 family protein [Streptomyces prunicolor]